jgi:hypothetical protein
MRYERVPIQGYIVLQKGGMFVITKLKGIKGV